MKTAAVILIAALATVCPLLHAGDAPTAAIALENDCVRYVIAPDGRNVGFIDKATGTDYAEVASTPFVASAKVSGETVNASKVSYESGHLTFLFGATGVRAIVRVGTEPRFFTLEVLSVTGEGVEELAFLNLSLTLDGKLEEPFACCALALNLQTNVTEMPGPNKRLHATCYKRFGFEGAKAAVIACPMAELRGTMKTVLSAADELPDSDIGGPWALDAEINRGSYLFDFGAVTEKTVDDWIAFVKTLGLNQIDFHTGRSLRFGDCFPNPELFPNGRASIKAVIDKLHDADIAAGLHTYAFFIAKDTPYVTPVPDARLGKDAAFTLAEPVDAEAKAVPVVEPTSDMSTTTGFFVRNSVTLQIDDELITYAAISKEEPYAFTECRRGAYGTKAAAHEKGAVVHHLKECFGLFTPDADSTLLAEVAANTAGTFNECGFDMIYLDALDGEDILAGGEWAWHYGSQFVFHIANRLEKPALFEMSTFHHHLWCVRARTGAWDHPSRSHKRYIDVHRAANEGGAGMFLPTNLGWWAVKTWQDGPFAGQNEPTFPDDIEYLMCKCLASDMGISLMGVNPGNIGAIPAYQRLAPIFKQYEDLRHAGYFPDAVKQKLKAPGEEFTLERRDDAWRFRRVHYVKHKVLGIDGWSNCWTATNKFGAQPLRLRIEALLSAAPYNSPQGVIIEDFAEPAAFGAPSCEANVTAELSRALVKAPRVEGRFSASSTRDDPNGAWAKIEKTFDPPLDIAEQRALGVWVHGDGQGELLNIQVRSPHHTVYGGIGDHYIDVDFEGPRYFELIEMEGARIEEHKWPYGGMYAIFRENVHYGQIASLSLWYNRLPTDKDTVCLLSPIKALPLVKAKLANPKVTIDGRTVTFPVEIESGCYLEFNAMSDCKLYASDGALLSDVTPEGEVPMLGPGGNDVQFDSGAADGTSARAYVTLIVRGEAL